jgi:hypothetical protein
LVLVSCKGRVWVSVNCDSDDVCLPELCRLVLIQEKHDLTYANFPGMCVYTYSGSKVGIYGTFLPTHVRGASVLGGPPQAPPVVLSRPRLLEEVRVMFIYLNCAKVDLFRSNEGVGNLHSWKVMRRRLPFKSSFLFLISARATASFRKWSP